MPVTCHKRYIALLQVWYTVCITHFPKICCYKSWDTAYIIPVTCHKRYIALVRIFCTRLRLVQNILTRAIYLFYGTFTGMIYPIYHPSNFRIYFLVEICLVPPNRAAQVGEPKDYLKAQRSNRRVSLELQQGQNVLGNALRCPVGTVQWGLSLESKVHSWIILKGR